MEKRYICIDCSKQKGRFVEIEQKPLITHYEQIHNIRPNTTDLWKYHLGILDTQFEFNETWRKCTN